VLWTEEADEGRCCCCDAFTLALEALRCRVGLTLEDEEDDEGADDGPALLDVAVAVGGIFPVFQGEA
jgi:hypothetical protein